MEVNTIGVDTADKAGAEWDEEKRLIADPRFKKDKEAERLLIGNCGTSRPGSITASARTEPT